MRVKYWSKKFLSLSYYLQRARHFKSLAVIGDLKSQLVANLVATLRINLALPYDEKLPQQTIRHSTKLSAHNTQTIYLYPR
jgi:hypothetical protein